MAVLGRSGSVELASRFAAALAAELRAVGITLDYAPVLDIHTNPKNPVIGDRALADDARPGRAPWRGHRPRAAGQRRGRVRQALSRARRHVGRFAPRSAARGASAGSDPAGRMRAVPRGDPCRRGVHHDRARAGAVAGRGTAGHAVAAHRAGHPARRARLSGRDPQRRPRDEGDREVLRGARGGRAGDCRRLRWRC